MRHASKEIQIVDNDEMLRRMGVVRRSISDDGSTIPSQGADWLDAFLFSSAPVRTRVREMIASTNSNDMNESTLSCEVIPGLHLMVFSRTTRRESTTTVAMFITNEILDSAYFEMLCQAAQLDRILVRSMLEQMNLIQPGEVDRTIEFISLLIRSEGEVSQRTNMLGDLGKQLGESYEEIHLYHSLIGSTSVSTSPMAFLTTVTDELKTVLPFSWIAIRILTDRINLPEDFDGFVVGGDLGRQHPVVSTVAERLALSIDGREPSIISTESDARFEGTFGFSSDVVVCPIAGDSGTIGVLLAGNDASSRDEASNIEMKLLGAASEHVSVFLRNAALYENLDSMFLGTVQAMVSAIDAKDRYTCGHSQRVAWLARELAINCGHDAEFVKRVHLAGLVHDVGKIGVPERVLSKPGRLDDDEFKAIQAHPEIGSRILRDIPQMDGILPAVMHHHERWDGRGYPDAISGEDIPLIARIVSIADAFDAMSSTRTYRAARPRHEVLAEMNRCRGTQFDPDLVGPFLAIDFEEYDKMIHGALHAFESDQEGRAAA
ncbi:MAG: hypothetical protein CMJ33_04165 [Phycisphaerae bacterium]|nr:hypothetical protein [Phycisphaerae bacterium]